MKSKWIEWKILEFLEAIPEIENGSPIKDYIDEYDLYEVTLEFARRLKLV